jgi:hypothetical protein
MILIPSTQQDVVEGIPPQRNTLDPVIKGHKVMSKKSVN